MRREVREGVVWQHVAAAVGVAQAAHVAVEVCEEQLLLKLLLVEGRLHLGLAAVVVCVAVGVGLRVTRCLGLAAKDTVAAAVHLELLAVLLLALGWLLLATERVAAAAATRPRVAEVCGERLDLLRLVPVPVQRWPGQVLLLLQQLLQLQLILSESHHHAAALASLVVSLVGLHRQRLALCDGVRPSRRLLVLAASSVRLQIQILLRLRPIRGADSNRDVGLSDVQLVQELDASLGGVLQHHGGVALVRLWLGRLALVLHLAVLGQLELLAHPHDCAGVAEGVLVGVEAMLRCTTTEVAALAMAGHSAY